MAAISIRDLDDEVRERLRVRAAQHGRSTEAEIRAGAPISGFEAQIAAICRAHQAYLSTRNTSDLDHLGLTLIDPWTTHL